MGKRRYEANTNTLEIRHRRHVKEGHTNHANQMSMFWHFAESSLFSPRFTKRQENVEMWKNSPQNISIGFSTQTTNYFVLPW